MRKLVLISALFLSTQISAEVTSGEKQVVPLVEFLAQKYIDAGFPDEDVHILPLDSDGEPVATLVVRYRGSSTSKRPILFLTHTDVVVAAGEWERDPFVLTEEAGYYWGRGVLDDKFATTILTTNFARLNAEFAFNLDAGAGRISADFKPIATFFAVRGENVHFI